MNAVNAPGADLPAICAHWQSVVTATCLRHAALLNLLPWGETDLAKLPAHVYPFAFRKCAELRDRAIDAELKLGTRPRQLERLVNAELWNALKTFRAADAPLFPPDTQQLPLE